MKNKSYRQKPSQKRTLQKKDEHISVRVQEQLKDKLQAIAIEKDRPLSWVVHKILEKYFDRPNGKAGGLFEKH